jgi:glutathione-regulated potassium-efflux system ancillary protein KefF
MILVVHAHPYPSHSRAGGALLAAVRGVPALEVRSLYDLYPDFDIDPDAERRALERARLVVLMHPIFWYTTPAILKHWFDEVLVKGWAYGEGGTALAGKDCLWVATTGGDQDAYSSSGRHAHPFDAFVPVVEQTARYCGMNWLEPFVVHGAHLVAPEALQAAGAELRARIDGWRKANGGDDA